MGLDVLAEGVERVGQLSVLRELGCDKAQGFLFAAPMSFEGARAMAARPPHWATTELAAER
jgi:EAL domain-containing protein (putative c-di-GMP-specific phosphodiesterase class I)